MTKIFEQTLHKRYMNDQKAHKRTLYIRGQQCMAQEPNSACHLLL